ncbi:hypothetical protein BM527_16500 [Alteromonas sp. Mex14]|nr:hypothetical protein BM527_16500 [Alteromonas sp. Mex14]
MSSYFLITGCVRSGTTLLEKLLCNHQSLSVLSQPFPILYIETKKRFLENLNINEYFSLSNLANERRYTVDGFTQFLQSTNFSFNQIKSCLNCGYSGELTPAILLDDQNVVGSYSHFYKSLTKNNAHKRNAILFGAKEVLVEEYIPYYLQENIKVIHIVRDPKDMLASITGGKGAEYIGNVKPTLFNIRNWRKSAQVGMLFKDCPNFLLVKYEDLVNDYKKELSRICKFLSVENFSEGTFEQGILNQDDTLWNSNSSYVKSSLISNKSVGRGVKVLDKKTLKLLEAVCFSEMNALKYYVDVNNLNEQNITGFEEKQRVTDTNIAVDYSTSKGNIEYEVSRFNEILFKDNYTFEFSYTGR